MQLFPKLAAIATLALASACAFGSDGTDVRVDDIYQGQTGSNNTQTMDVGNVKSKRQNGQTWSHVYARGLRQFQSGDHNTQTMRIGNNAGEFASSTSTRISLGNITQSQGGSGNRQTFSMSNND